METTAISSISLSLAQARADIERAGFGVQVCGDHLVVADPVHRSGHGPQAGKLIPAGFESVVIRSQQQAWRFLRARV